MLSPDVVWHQPGQGPLSGDHKGTAAVLAHLGRFMALSEGTFALELLGTAEAGDLVSATVRFSATRPGRAPLNQCGVDVFRVKDGRIAQVWLISEDIDAEDAFWI